MAPPNSESQLTVVKRPLEAEAATVEAEAAPVKRLKQDPPAGVMVMLVYTGDGAAPDDTRLIVGDIPASANLPLDPEEEPPSLFLGTLEANFPELHAFLLPAWTGVHPGEVKCDGSEADRLLLLRPSVCVRVWANYNTSHFK